MLIQACRREFQMGELVTVRKDGRILTVRRYSVLRMCLGLPYVLCGSEHAGRECGQWFRERGIETLDMAAFLADFERLNQLQ
jgi:hypothetical protein